MGSRRWRLSLATLALVSFLSCPEDSSAADLRLSGFGTLGYARSSERDLSYLRYIDNDGTLKADSIVGVQAEAQFNAQWGATLQAAASAPRERDDGYEAKLRWAFVSFRPDNDWLLRAGRVRPPFFINTQNAEIGVTYDVARLPVEVYSASPIYDFDGLSVSKSWALKDSELNLEVFWGESDSQLRGYVRDEHKANYEEFKVRARGMVVSHNSGSLLLRAGIHRANAEYEEERRPVETLKGTQPFDPVPPPLGGTLYVPVNPKSSVGLTLYSLGADWLSAPWHVTAEYVKRVVSDIDSGIDSDGAYVTVSRTVGRWTPYATYARLLSGSKARDVYGRVNSAPVPLLAQGAPAFVPSSYHRLLVDNTILAFDQYSAMLGASYRFSATSKLKLEWMHTKVGLVSGFVDGDAQDRSMNVFSLSYSVAF